ncbi:MAG: bifunctional 3,4-dihydroxy-2-butanone-4-phosphate synthase/GTP cyclohydrolase II [candidate division Zixibacteria bacterium]|nr:bifunctional 3,4-dihydroxy-2-butanone-4-phosphate synthase/GTP cyclohydrolase II [candidate division Zixibacteria bacterium]
MSELNTIEEAIEDIKQGKMVIVVDDADRENEGDMILAAEKVTPEAINFISKFARGLVCVPLTRERIEQLDLSPMVKVNTAKMGTRFTVSVDAMYNTTTGISTHDRAQTIKTLIDPKTLPEELARPGHIFPLQAQDGGVLSRAGHTEATMDLARLAGLYPAGILCEIMDEDGRMARLPSLLEMAKRFDLKIISVKDLIEYRIRKEKLVKRIVSVNFPTKYGHFKLHLYKSMIDEHHHLALEKGEVKGKENVLVRVHSQCLTGDVFGSARCDCGDQLAHALSMIEKEGLGVFLYMRQEGRGIGLSNKIRAYQLQDCGLDTVQANIELGFDPDLRDYGIGAQILVDLGLSNIRLITNNPKKIIGIEGYGLKVTERIPTEVSPTPENIKYLETKRDKLGHLLKVRENGSPQIMGINGTTKKRSD